jgi:hypothetical protein
MKFSLKQSWYGQRPTDNIKNENDEKRKYSKILCDSYLAVEFGGLGRYWLVFWLSDLSECVGTAGQDNKLYRLNKCKNPCCEFQKNIYD